MLHNQNTQGDQHNAHTRSQHLSLGHKQLPVSCRGQHWYHTVVWHEHAISLDTSIALHTVLKSKSNEYSQHARIRQNKIKTTDVEILHTWQTYQDTSTFTLVHTLTPKKQIILQNKHNLSKSRSIIREIHKTTAHFIPNRSDVKQ